MLDEFGDAMIRVVTTGSSIAIASMATTGMPGSPRSPEDVRETMAGGFREERLAEVIRGVGGIPWFERVALLYYVWHRASVALARLVPRHDLISAACMHADGFLSRLAWARRNLIRLIWGFDKPRHSGAGP